jgi:hypothetical protein
VTKILTSPHVSKSELKFNVQAAAKQQHIVKAPESATDNTASSEEPIDEDVIALSTRI